MARRQEKVLVSAVAVAALGVATAGPASARPRCAAVTDPPPGAWTCVVSSTTSFEQPDPLSVGVVFRPNEGGYAFVWQNTETDAMMLGETLVARVRWSTGVGFNGRQGVVSRSLRVLVGAEIRTTFFTQALDARNRLYRTNTVTRPARRFGDASVPAPWGIYFRGRQYWLRWYLTVAARNAGVGPWRSEAIHSPDFCCGPEPFEDKITSCYFPVPN